MSQTTEQLTVQLERQRLHRAERQFEAQIVVGKDILELLSTAMYVDPLTIYREYVQNAADAIDEAYRVGVLIGAHAGHVAISLDATTREIRIRDNGLGVSAPNVERVLTAFGASSKRDRAARGFRGVGRFAALGFAQFVTFRTKAVGEREISQVRWDCRRLKAILLDPSYAGDLNQVVRDVVTVSTLGGADVDDHFFEVHLERVVRLKNDALLNDLEVSRYLSQVAPAPFHEDFPYREQIAHFLADYVPVCPFHIFINDSSEPITRPFRTAFEVTKGKTGAAAGVERIEIRDADGAVRAVGWLLAHEYLGAIHAAAELRGLRARVGDIQIGGDDIFEQVFPESRFNSWTIGELHIVDRRIVPNGRRDNFEQNGSYYQLISQLMPLGRAVAKQCRVSSAKRNRLKAFEARALRAHELLEKVEQGALSRASETAVRKQVGACLGEMEKILGGNLIIDQGRRGLERKLIKLRSRLDAIRDSEGQSDPLKGVHPRKRAVYEEVIGLIYECSTNRVAAKALVDRIAARLSGLR